MALIDELKDLRLYELGGARLSLRESLFKVAEARAELVNAQRTDDGSPAAQQTLADAHEALATAQANLQEGRDTLRVAKEGLAAKKLAWVPKSLSPADEILRLESRQPIVFLPVRIETRFALAQGKLRIRVYPDDIFGSTHEAELTDGEVAQGQNFLNSEQTLEDWKMLIRGRTPQRAAWILRALGLEQSAGKADSWTLPVETDLLPDRFIAIGYRPDGTTVTEVGSPIEEPLRLVVDPSSNEEDTVGGLPIDPELKWTVDFDAARAAGMGLELEIPADSRGFARLLVFGVKGSMDASTSAAALSELFEDHRYSRGLALVRQGTPTNNTPGRDSGFPLDDRGGAVSYELEFPSDGEATGGDGQVLEKTLGLRPQLFDRLAGANGTEQASAKAMNDALWPVSFGYFLQHMLDPVLAGKPLIFADTAIEEARLHFTQYVRGRGPCPAFRVGAVPYGVLPVSSLDRWKPNPALTGGLDVRLPPKLRSLRALWLAKAKVGAARIRKNPNDPDDDLLKIIGLHPSTRQVRVRSFLGDAVQLALFQLLRRDWGPWASALAALAKQSFDLIGEGGNWNVRVGRATASPSAFLFRHPLVAPEPLREDLDAEGNELVERTEDQPILNNYIDWLRLASIEQIRTHDRSGKPVPQALLYHVLRHALLTEYARLGYKYLDKVDVSRRIHEFIKILFGGADEQTTIWDRFAQPFPPSPSFGDFVQNELAGGYHDALRRLAGLSQAELERLFTETLDVASHRLDAWITSVFTKRLFADRNADTPEPSQSYLGAFAWVEDLHPASAGTASGGFIHAPSTAHAATAAILRNGFLTRRAEAAGRFAFDLSSDRVWVARGILDALRAGQPAGAVLGYRFERALHDATLDRFIDPLRKRYPLIANKAGQSSDPPEAVAARSVVDGLALRLDWQRRTSDDAFFAALTVTPPPSPVDKAALSSPLNALDAAVDGVADLLTAESVYQMVRGNAAGAAAPLDALAAGAQPPDPDVARTPRGGTSITHRLLWVWKADPDPTPWSAASTRRSDAESVLDAWVGQILGAPGNSVCWVTFTDGNQATRKPISVAALKIRPLDVLELAQESPDTTQELRRRILQAAAEGGAKLDDAEVQFDPVPSDNFTPVDKKTFPELLDLARQVNALLGRSRPGRPVDLLPLDGRDPPASSEDELKEFGRARDIAFEGLRADLAQLKTTIESGTAMAFRPALRRAAEYMPGAFPDPRESEGDLLVRATLAKADLDRRREAAQAVLDGNAGATGTPEAALAMYRAIFGRTFLRLPRFTLGAEAKKEIDQAIAKLVLRPRQPGNFLQQNARVRAPLGTWRRMWLYAEASGVTRPTVDVAQLPLVPGETWAGDDGVPAGSRLSLLLARTSPSRPDLGAPAAAMVVDEWTEVIPNAEEQTGIAFHYDNPGVEAAQAILVAVRPDPGQSRWSLEDITAALNETLDLAKVRAVEPELIGETRQALPALYLTANLADEAISTDFAGLLQDRPVRVPGKA